MVSDCQIFAAPAVTRLDSCDSFLLAAALLGRREKHLEWSVASMLDRLTNRGEGEVDFMMDNNQVERLVKNLVTPKAVVGSVILVTSSILV